MIKIDLRNSNTVWKAVLIVLILARFAFVGKGFFAFPDEWRFTESVEAVKALVSLDTTDFWQHIFKTQGRPADALLKLIPAAVIYCAHHFFGTLLFNEFAASVMFLFNFSIYLLLLRTYFNLFKTLLNNEHLAWFGIVLYSCLTLSFISLRHSDPYDSSQLFFVWILVQICRSNFTLKSAFHYGFVAFFAYLVYPGNILLYGIIAVFYGFTVYRKLNFKTAFFHVSTYGLGSFFLLLLTELASRFSSMSFLRESLWLSTSILQGSFSEAYTFIFKYFIEVESVLGIALLMGFFCGSIVLLIKQIPVLHKEKILALLLISVAFFLFYASASFFLEKVVWYARLLKQFIPILLVVALLPLSLLSNKWQNSSLTFFSLLALISFALSWKEYRTVNYPRDLLFAQLQQHGKTAIQTTTEFKNFIPFYAQQPTKNTSYTLVNFGIVFPYRELSDYRVYRSKSNETLVLDVPDCTAFKAYQFEGYNMEERANINKQTPRLKIYRLNLEAKKATAK